MENESYDGPLPAALFERMDNEDDSVFYQMPRFVLHVDEPTIEMLTQYLDETLPAEPRILDLMSSWVSHLPARRMQEVVCHGMNADELKGNPRADRWFVQDLNRSADLPLCDESFDTVLISFSVQYLTDPVAVFKEIGRVLTPGGRLLVAMSHRCFATKAIRAFHALDPPQRVQFLGYCLGQSRAFEKAVSYDRSPQDADPLWIVEATAKAEK